MIPELGEFSLVLALCLAVLLATIPLAGTIGHRVLWMSYAKPLARGQFLFLFISFLCLAYAFASDDFSVNYVANHSNSQMPAQYKLSAVWGGHEGSLLLWALILGGWTAAVSLFSRDLSLDMLARVLSVMGMISIGFILFILLTSSPFARTLVNIPIDGRDLNPLLQDFGLIVHPPMLYMGYVGFSVAFAFAIAALMSGRLDAAWARWSRPWTTVAWAFLGMGITLGSWWAYYELGWGGWWFWDPVENASFMPWLVGTALLHSLAATEKRGVFKSWTVFLAIFAFSLSLLGTFLVRSGVLTSVHAFASDPSRGFFVLMLLAITVGASLTLYAVRAPNVRSESGFTLFSRETFILVNNVLLSVAAITVLLGTLYPLLLDALGKGKISVGPPYFNAVFVPLMALLAVTLGIATVVRWKKTESGLLMKKLWLPGVLSLLTGIIFSFTYGGSFDFRTVLGISLMMWLVLTAGWDLIDKLRNRNNWLMGLTRLPRSYYGMQLAHIGFGIAIVGVTLVSVYSEERDLRMAPGDNLEFAGYKFVFAGAKGVRVDNYTADRGEIIIYSDDELVTTLYPEKRRYNVQQASMTEAAIDAGLFRDLYVAMGEPLEDGAWAIRVHYKPYVRWLWLGGLCMGLGGLLAAMDKRYRRKTAQQTVTTGGLSHA